MPPKPNEVKVLEQFAKDASEKVGQELGGPVHCKYEGQPHGPLKNRKYLQPLPGWVYPRHVDGQSHGVVPAPVAVSLECLLRCLFLEMPFERLQQQTRVTRDVDRFASRYLVPLFRCACSCHMVSGGAVDKSLVPLCLEIWLSQMTRNNGRNGFHLPNFNLTPGEISEISHKTWSIFLDVSEKSNV